MTTKTIALRDLRDTLDRCLSVAKVDASRALNIVDQVAFAYVHYQDGIKQVATLLETDALAPITWTINRADDAIEVSPENAEHKPNILMNAQALIDVAAANTGTPVYFNWEDDPQSPLLIQAMRKSVWGTNDNVVVARLGEDCAAMAVTATGDMYTLSGEEASNLLERLGAKARDGFNTVVLSVAQLDLDGEPTRSNTAYAKRRSEMLEEGMQVEKDLWEKLWTQSRKFLVPFTD